MGRLVNDEEFRYYKQVAHRIQEDFEDDEEREIFLENVYREMKNRELDLACNKIISKVIEDCLNMSLSNHNFEYHIQFLEAFGENFRLICKNQFAGHVIQTIVYGVPAMFETFSKETSADDKVMKQVESLVLKLSKFVLNNFTEFISDTYATYIVRTLIQLLGGTSADKLLSKGRKGRMSAQELKIKSPDTLPSSFGECLSSFCEQLIEMSNDFPSWACDELISPVLQTLLVVISRSNAKYCKKLIKLLLKMTTEKKDGQRTTSLMYDDKGSRLMEIMIAVCDSKSRKKHFDKYFSGQFENLCLHPISNFVVQNLIKSIEEKELFVAMFQEISPHFKTIISNRKFGILVALSESCLRRSTCQGTFVTELMNALNCSGGEDQLKAFIPCVCELTIYHSNFVFDRVNINGSLIVQNLLKFNKPIKTIQNIMSLDSSDLCGLICDKSGSYIIDAFMLSSTVGEKSRIKLIEKLKGSYLILACDKFGSRCLDKIWETSPINLKVVIASELISKQQELEKNMFGKLISNNMALWNFKKNQGQWKKIQSERSNKKRILDDVIGDKSPKKQKVT